MRKKLRNLFDQYQQKENHITHSLLVVLNHNRELLKAILSKYGIRLSSSQINFLTQVSPKNVSEKDSIPDGYIYTEEFDFCIGIEIKIVSNKLRENQISGHIDRLLEYEISYLLIISPDEEEPTWINSVKDRYPNIRFIPWPGLLQFMIEVGPDKNSNNVGTFLFQEFISYIERNYQMTPFMGFRFQEGYDLKLATHYVKRVSETLTPKIVNSYPKCVNKRQKISSDGKYPWEAWYSSSQPKYCVHPALGVQPHQIRCYITLPNECDEWKHFSKILDSNDLLKSFKSILKKLYENAIDGSDTVVSFRQRHFTGQTRAHTEAETTIKVATLLGIDGFHENNIWWELLRSIARTKNKYNYQLEIGYDIEYDKVKELMTLDAIEIMISSYKNLKPIYVFLLQ
jgi:hypothetical protein